MQVRDTLREAGIRSMKLHYSKILYQKLALRNHTSKERIQRKELNIKELKNINCEINYLLKVYDLQSLDFWDYQQ